VYATNPLARLQNATVARLIRSFVDRRPPGQPVRILEVGAGTGATTEQILPMLPADRIEYRFTDVSTYFTERARSKFARYPFIEYGVYDIDRDPQAQGVPPASVDVVVGANVIHNAKDLRPTLANLTSILAPGGVLVLIENTVNSVLHMVTVGFIQDFANYQDGRELPLLSPTGWQEYFAAAGIGRSAAFPAAGVDAMEQHVLVGQAPDGPRRLDPADLRTALEGLLPAYLVPHHYLIINRLPLSANGKIDHSALPTLGAQAAAEPSLAPRTEMECKLFEIWSDALGRTDFGIRDNFFELGGDSLHAVRILGRLRDEVGIQENAEEGLQRLFDYPTIAELAATLQERAGA
jgi:SAM-dependent methyltransferase/acyl carrier protein